MGWIESTPNLVRPGNHLAHASQKHCCHLDSRNRTGDERFSMGRALAKGDEYTGPNGIINQSAEVSTPMNALLMSAFGAEVNRWHGLSG